MITADRLYQPDKYRVILGEGKTAGFCTVWNEPEKAIKECPDLLKKSAVIGALYCSPFGVSGKEVLLKLWKESISAEGIVNGTDFKLKQEIDVSIVEIICKNVELVELNDDDIA